MTEPTNETTTSVTLEVEGDGTALQLVAGTSTFGLVKVEVAAPATVMWVPDPDNPDDNTIFWVQGVPGVGSALPEGSVVLTLTYAGE